MTGVVKFFKAENNYGFITPDDGGTDIFFHGSKVDGRVQKDDVVTYEIGDGKKWPEAINVRKVDAEEDEYA